MKNKINKERFCDLIDANQERLETASKYLFRKKKEIGRLKKQRFSNAVIQELYKKLTLERKRHLDENKTIYECLAELNQIKRENGAS
jgi:hypothetical protein